MVRWYGSGRYGVVKGDEAVLCGLERGQEGVRVRRVWGGGGDLGDGAVEEHAQGDVLARGQREGREVRPHGEVGPAVAADGETELEASAVRTVAEDRLVCACVRCVCMFEYIVWCAHVHGHLCMCIVHVGTAGAPARRRYRRRGRRRWR